MKRQKYNAFSIAKSPKTPIFCSIPHIFINKFQNILYFCGLKFTL